MSAAVIHRLRIHRLAIPLRVTVRHATAERVESDPVVVEVELASGLRGFGETLARTYVTQENAESVLTVVERLFVPAILNFHPESFPNALEFIEALPWRDTEEEPVPAARAAIELALLDVSMRYFHRGVDDIVQWMGLPGYGLPGSSKAARYSGVLATNNARTMMRRLRLMYWAGLRHFKIKVGSDGDASRVQMAAKYLSRAVNRRKASLRIDANGAWSLKQAEDWLTAMAGVPIDAVEQPLPRGQEDRLFSLRTATGMRFAHDESLINEMDARRLIERGVADYFNIRISKCGGLLPAIRLAALARKNNVGIQIGCMVGETSILSAAGLRLLQIIPNVRWIEGCFGNLLLQGDVVRKPLRFGFGGRPPALGHEGWGIDVEDRLLSKWAQAEPKTMDL